MFFFDAMVAKIKTVPDFSLLPCFLSSKTAKTFFWKKMSLFNILAILILAKGG